MPHRRPVSRRRLILLPVLLVLTGAGLLITEAVSHSANLDLILYGIVAMLAGIGLANLALIWTTREPADMMFRDGYDLGYRRGLDDGREQSRPTVVPIRRRDAG